jgi:eight-cysteine-cluster-containing protein
MSDGRARVWLGTGRAEDHHPSGHHLGGGGGGGTMTDLAAARAAGCAVDPVELYQSCKTRVEGPEETGECRIDADCATAGCSGEVCATKEAVAGLMSTCEVRPCFAALDTCGCIEGVCSWTLKSGPVSPLPGGGRSMPLPPQ